MWLSAIAYYTWKVLLPLYYRQEENRTELVLTVIQAALLILSLHNIFVQSRRFENGTPVSYVYQTLTWITAGKRITYYLLNFFGRLGRYFLNFLQTAIHLRVLVANASTPFALDTKKKHTESLLFYSSLRTLCLNTSCPLTQHNCRGNTKIPDIC